jgi:predicted CXXCH cytochrome family protein
LGCGFNDKKKLLTLILIAASVALATSAFGQLALSRHNLSASNALGTPRTADPNASACGLCHVPHGADLSIAGFPLWAKDLSTHANTFVPYGGAIVGGTGTTLAGTTVNQPGANSLNCLSCHDGTVGLNVIYKNGWQVLPPFAMIPGSGFLGNPPDSLDWAGYDAGPTPTFNPVIGGAAGSDLTNDHPIGILYTAGIAGLDPIATPQGVGLRFYDYGAGDTVQCASCHDPHDITNPRFLRRPAANICQDCHAQK